MTVPERGSFDDVAWEALKAAEEIFHGGGSSAKLNPLVALTEYPLLSVEDFLVDE